MELEAFVTQLREELEMGAMSPSDRLSDFPKAFRLKLDNHLDISLKEKNPGIWLKAPLRAAPDEKLEELYTHLMEANLFGQGTRGSSLGLDASGDMLELQMELKHELNYRSFRDAIEDFANLIEYWQTHIDAHVEENATME
jgi:hypothetical protein